MIDKHNIVYQLERGGIGEVESSVWEFTGGGGEESVGLRGGSCTLAAGEFVGGFGETTGV